MPALQDLSTANIAGGFFRSLLPISLLLLAACESNPPDERETSADVFNANHIDKAEIMFDTLSLEKLPLELGPGESSYEGFTEVRDGSIRFMDTQTSDMFVFDLEGNLLERTLGRGEGPEELPGVAGPRFYATTPDGRHVFIGSSNDLYVFDPDFNRTHTLQIGWRGIPPGEMEGATDPDNDRAYNMAYDATNIRVTDQHIYLALEGAPPPFLPDFNRASDRYAEEGRILARIDLESGKILEVVGRLSPLFAEDESTRFFAYPVFDLRGDDELVLTFAPDPQIYAVDSNFTVRNSFGREGEDMDTNYRPIPVTEDPAELGQYARTEISSRSVYRNLTAVEERDLVFRTYKRDRNATADGLQIYRDETFIADVDVPRQSGTDLYNTFEVVGYEAPYFYSNVFTDEAYEELWVYRFTIAE